MAQAKTLVREALADDAPEADGRKQRSRSSRNRILEAMMALIAEGHHNPSAAAVAERAGVGLRSVFRHFDDKDSLFREMHERLVAAYAPRIQAPYASSDWRERLQEFVERRVGVFEEIAPFRLSTVAHRYRSEALAAAYAETLAMERAMLEALLPSRVCKARDTYLALRLATSFDGWRVLRQDEGLSANETVEAMTRMVRDIVDRVDD